MKINLYFDENNIYTHFFFSELLILWEKNLRIFFFAIGVPKKFLKILKKYHTGELHKKYTILQQTPLITLFFDSPCI